ncbi:MAG: PIN domain-containing protein [Candidatus Bathyarchaeia archaeon]
MHSYNKTSPYQKRASSVIRRALDGKIEACITPQTLYEFFAVVTNAKRVEHPLPASEAAEICLDLWKCREIEKVDPTPMAPKEVFNLVKKLKFSRGKVFDCLLAVTARENNIRMIYTENVEDFKDYGFIRASNPLT